MGTHHRRSSTGRGATPPPPPKAPIPQGPTDEAPGRPPQLTMPVPTMAECVQMATAVVNRAWRHQVTHIVDVALKEPHVSRPAGIVIYPPTHTIYMAAAAELQHELTKRSPQAWRMELALAGEDAGKTTWTRAEDGR